MTLVLAFLKILYMYIYCVGGGCYLLLIEALCFWDSISASFLEKRFLVRVFFCRVCDVIVVLMKRAGKDWSDGVFEKLVYQVKI